MVIFAQNQILSPNKLIFFNVMGNKGKNYNILKYK